MAGYLTEKNSPRPGGCKGRRIGAKRIILHARGALSAARGDGPRTYAGNAPYAV